MDVGNYTEYPTGQSADGAYAPPAAAPGPRRRRRRTQNFDPRCSVENGGP